MASVDFFLKIEGVEGESGDSKHSKEIELHSWSWSEAQHGASAAGGGGGAGKVHMQDFHFTMTTNKASPKMFLACATGEHIKKATLTCRKAGKTQQEYLKIIMSDLLIASFSTGGSGGADIMPIDQISISFAKIEFEYHPQKADGTLDAAVKGCYDLKKNEKC